MLPPNGKMPGAVVQIRRIMDEGKMYEMLMLLLDPRGPPPLVCHRMLAEELRQQPRGKAGYVRALLRVADAVDPSGKAELVLRLFLGEYLSDEKD